MVLIFIRADALHVRGTLADRQATIDMCPLSDCHDKDAITGMALVQLSFLYLWFLLVLHNFNCRYMTLAHEPILHLLVSRLSSETLIQRNLFSECLKL